MARGRVAKKKYFDIREEHAVIDYITSDSSDEKHRIYNDILREPFRKMVESIIRKYPTHIGNYDIHEIEANALSHLIEHMIKYRPFIIEFKDDDGIKWERSKVYTYFFLHDAEEKLQELLSVDSDKNFRIFQSKAFSYCQTIVRNFYKDHSKRSYNEKKTILSWEDHSSEIMGRNEFLYEIDGDEKSDLEALIDIVVKNIRDRIDGDASLKKNEIIVGEAIINVLGNWHILFLEETPDGKINKKITNKYQKNKILQLLKEQTRLNTKEIRMSMKPFKEIYYLQKKEFYEDEN